MYKNNFLLVRSHLLIGCALLLTTGSFCAFAEQAPTHDERYLKKTILAIEDNIATLENEALCCETSSNKKTKSIVLPNEAINKLVINAGFGWGIFSGSIYNGNNNYTVTQLNVSMTPIHDHHMEMMEMSSHETKEYKIDLNLLPLSKGALSLAIDADDTHIHDFEWEIIQAVGHKTNSLSDAGQLDSP